jgi:methionyl-tRNA formyltransferase
VRTVFLGTSEFAAGVLRRIAETSHRPRLVVTRPARPAGRGRHLAEPPVAEAARELGLELSQPDVVGSDDSRERIARAEPELLLLCAYGALIKEPLLSEHEILNAHPSLLPRWRGAAPVERAIMAGDERTGVSIMRVTAGLDSGPVCLRGDVPIEPDDDYATLAARLEPLGAELLLRAIEERPPFEEQDESGVTYAQKIAPPDRTLDPAAPAIENERRVRALHPHIGARLELPDGSFLGVRRARAREDGTLELLEVQPPGGRPMPYADYARGHGAVDPALLGAR